ncbi:MAG: glycosyltransferase family 39 protein [Myxococcota bacterium]
MVRQAHDVLHPVPGASRPPPAPRITALKLLLLTTMAALQVDGISVSSLSRDEIYHLPAGYSHLVTGDFRLGVQHPPAVKLLSALPLLLLDVEADFQGPAWQRADELAFGLQFFRQPNADLILFVGRLPNVLLSLVGALFVFDLGLLLFGASGALGALLLYALSPHLIAHGRLVTTDQGVTTFLLGTLLFLACYLRDRRVHHLLLAGVMLGLAAGTKFSALLIIPVIGWRLLGEVLEARMRARDMLLSLGVVILVAVLVVVPLYGWPLRPGAYLHGLRLVNVDHSPAHEFFLDGEFFTGRRRDYFLWAFLHKTPVPLLVLLLLSVATWMRLQGRQRLEAGTLCLAAAVWFVGTSLGAAPVGIRYLLPVYGLLAVLAGAAVAIPRWHTLALAAWYALGTVATHPHELAYFNEPAGGWRGGHTHLDESNVDWGDGLIHLRRWMDEHEVDRLRVFVMWRNAPELYGIPHERVSQEELFGSPAPGLYAISTQAVVWCGGKGGRCWPGVVKPVDRAGHGFFIYQVD